MSNESDEVARLKAENLRLIAVLEAQGIDWRQTDSSTKPARASEPESSQLTTQEKIETFRRLFRGRTDVFSIRWENKAGRSGYAPACANEWKPGICEKPRIKCADCGYRKLIPLSDDAIYNHLAGKHTIGVYPLLADDTCYFLAADFDDADWRDDVRAFIQSCRELQLPVATEISRSGNGAHAWIFFSTAIPACDARHLGAAIISHTCARTRQLALTSYDRLFPNQDRMPKGGFGNLIALPLQKKPREQGFSLFVDDQLNPIADQWVYLAAIETMTHTQVQSATLAAIGTSHVLDVAFIDDEDHQEPWKRPPSATTKLPAPLPKSLTITLANLIYFEKAQLPQPLANRLIRLAAFQNPEFYKAQAMRFPVWDKPRIIGCAENYPAHIALPRGCLDAAKTLLSDNGILGTVRDERSLGKPIVAPFSGTLRTDQQAAVDAMLTHDIGVLCAPTAFGKTVTAASLIARRGVNTLILVHRTELLKQWRERLRTFLNVDEKFVGTIGGGKTKPTGLIDIAVMQSLSRKDAIDAVVENYGHIVIDECHHVSAFSFEAILKRSKAKYVLGLTATPFRRDGHQPIIFMQCGPIRHTAAQATTAPQDLEVVPHSLLTKIDLPDDAPIQDVFRYLATDTNRTAAIKLAIEQTLAANRKVLVLTERTEHLEAIRAALGSLPNCFALHGRMPKKQRDTVITTLAEMAPDAPRVLLATGKLVGEGFDHPPLDTLILAMPISWKGTLQQYAGRLHREHVGKTGVQVIDIVDSGHPVLRRMWLRRQSGYKAMGYRIGPTQDGFPR